MNITLDSIKQPINTIDSLERNYLYKDLSLDIKKSVWYDRSINKKSTLNDVQALYDIDAVTNSLRSCFLTAPRQRILNPTYGIDLRRFLFTPISQNNAFFMARDIERLLPSNEPRVVVTNVTVTANEDEQQYEIFLQIDVPTLNIYGLTLQNILNSNGYF